MTKFSIKNTAQQQIKQAIRRLGKTGGEHTARDTIKGVMTDFQNQLTVLPESGKKCQYLDSDVFREMIKGQYRFVYRLEQQDGAFHVTVVMFCHTRMDYATLLNVSMNID